MSHRVKIVYNNVTGWDNSEVIVYMSRIPVEGGYIDLLKGGATVATVRVVEIVDHVFIDPNDSADRECDVTLYCLQSSPNRRG